MQIRNTYVCASASVMEWSQWTEPISMSLSSGWKGGGNGLVDARRALRLANSESRRRVHHNGTGPTNQQATGAEKTRQPSVRLTGISISISNKRPQTPHTGVRSKTEKKAYGNVAQVEGLH
jgi:hypothetical protein